MSIGFWSSPICRPPLMAPIGTQMIDRHYSDLMLRIQSRLGTSKSRRQPSIQRTQAFPFAPTRRVPGKMFRAESIRIYSTRIDRIEHRIFDPVCSVQRILKTPRSRQRCASSKPAAWGTREYRLNTQLTDAAKWDSCQGIYVGKRSVGEFNLSHVDSALSML